MCLLFLYVYIFFICHIVYLIFPCSEKNPNSQHLLAAEESSLGNWSSLINYNSSFDSSIRETEYEDRISPDNAL